MGELTLAEKLWEISSLIRFHQNCLDQYGQFISPSAQQLEKRTIENLELLHKMLSGKQVVK